jgi:hypothetical protein
MRLVRKVVDSNFLRNPALAHYLARSRRNVAVLTEFVVLEAHKRDAMVTVPKSIAILARHPRQVEMLRTSQRLLGFPGRSAGLQQRLIDHRRSRGFPRYCRRVADAVAGNAACWDEIRHTADVASTHIASLVDSAPTIIDLFQRHARRFSRAEMAVLRLGKPRCVDIQRKLIDVVFESAIDVAKATGAIGPRFRPEEIVNLPVFRYCLCMMLLFIRWIEDGRQTAAGPRLVANDVIDANIAAYATYFDGVLSADEKLLSLHREARHVLREIGGNVPA